jgi:probable rRNA maturation factor
MNLSVDIEDDSWLAIQGLEGLADEVVSKTLAVDDQRSIALLFTTDAAVQEINTQWRGIEKPTNVLSFPSAPMPVPDGEVAHLGDIVLAFETVAREAAEAGKTLSHHASHLIVHGTLHLLGYDHQTDADATRMETRERDILATLGIADPYLT